MPGALPVPVSCPCDEEVSTLVPGGTGSDGEDGDDGSDGANAYTTLAAEFTMPAEGEEVTITVNNGDWIGLNQILFIEFAGYMKATELEGNSITVLNLGVDGNAAEDATIANGSKVSPGGPQGVSGADGATTELSGTGSPEAAVIGSPGWGYTDTSIPAYWKKLTGTATNTGWVLIVSAS